MIKKIEKQFKIIFDNIESYKKEELNHHNVRNDLELEELEDIRHLREIVTQTDEIPNQYFNRT